MASRFGDNSSGLRRVAFACSLEGRIKPKIRTDVARILEAGKVDEVVYFCESNLPVGRRHALQGNMRSVHGIELQVFDGTAIAEFLTDRDLFWIAQQYLHVPSELMPPASQGDARYTRHIQRWKNRKPFPMSSSDFQEVRFGLRSATFDEDAKPDILIWLDLMRAFLREPAPRQLQRAASYVNTDRTLTPGGLAKHRLTF